MVEQIPNALTTFRIGLAGAFAHVPPRKRATVLLLSLGTDCLDGALSRRFGWQSEVGRLLDPIADKLFFAAVAGTLAREAHLRWRDLLALSIRDLAVAAWGINLLAHDRLGNLESARPRLLGKLTTGAQYLALLQTLRRGKLTPEVAVGTGVLGLLAARQYYREAQAYARAA